MEEATCPECGARIGHCHSIIFSSDKATLEQQVQEL